MVQSAPSAGIVGPESEELEVMRQDGGLRAKLHGSVGGCQWSAIESGATVRGIPDSEYCFPGGRSGWVECKVRRGGAKIKFRPGQAGWLMRRVRMGGRAFVLVQGDDNVAIYGGGDAGSLAKGVAVEAVRSWPRGRVDWREVAKVLAA